MLYLSLTSIIYGISGLLLVITSVALYFSYAKTRIFLLKHLSIMFGFFASFLFALSLPVFFAPERLDFIGIGFIVGTLFIYGILFTAIRIGRNVDIHLFRQLTAVSTLVVAATGIGSLAILTTDFRLPEIGEWGVILWNLSPIASTFLSISCIYTGSMWTYIFFKAGKIVWMKDKLASIKFFIFANNGITCGISALLVFSATVEWVSLVGLGLMGFACLITMVIFLLPSKASASVKTFKIKL